MLVFYALPVSNYCAKVEIALRAKGLQFETRSPPGGYGSADYRKLVPAGTIPALVDGDLVLSESEVINEYLEDAYPEPPLLPPGAKERAHARLVARFHDSRLEPPLRALFPHMDPARRDPSVVTARLAEYRERLGQLAAMVAPAPFATGPALSLADAGYPATWLMAELMLDALGEPVAMQSPLAAWQAALAAHPAVRPVLASAEEALRAWLASKGAA